MLDKLLASLGLNPQEIMRQVQMFAAEIEAFKQSYIQAGMTFKATSEHFDARLKVIETKLDRLLLAFDTSVPDAQHTMIEYNGKGCSNDGR